MSAPGGPPPSYDDTVRREQSGAAKEQKESEKAKAVDPDETFRVKLQALMSSYEISKHLHPLLMRAKGRDYILILDNSGSTKRSLHSDAMPGPGELSRWKEIEQRTILLTEFVTVFDQDGITILPMNPPRDARGQEQCVFTATDTTQVQQIMKTLGPDGLTPTCATLRRAYNLVNPKKPTVIIVLTDGEATKDDGSFDDQLPAVLAAKPRNVTVTIAACTNVPRVLEYLAKLDAGDDTLDVVADYESERKEIQAVQGLTFSFTWADYVIKTALGSFVRELDQLDEPAPRAAAAAAAAGAAAAAPPRPYAGANHVNAAAVPAPAAAMASAAQQKHRDQDNCRMM